MNKNLIKAVLWNDAAYSNLDKLPDFVPPPRLTVGLIIEDNKEFINIAMNVYYYSDDNTIDQIDGFLIPKNTIISIKEIGDYGSK